MNVKVIHTKNLRWVDVVNPGDAEINYLKQNFTLHPLDYEDIISTSQHPKIEDRDDYHFVVLLFPVFNKKTRQIRPAEVDFIISEDYVVTIHDGSMYTMVNLVSSVLTHDSMRNFYMSKNSGYLVYQILESLFRRSFPILDHISKDMSEIEQEVFEDLGLRMLERISQMKKNIIDFRRIMKTHHLILKKFMGKRSSYIVFQDSKTYYSNLVEHSENIWDILAIQKETVEALQDANQALAANHLNEITRVITIMSAVFLPATLIIFLAGLNLKDNPLVSHSYGFLIVLALSVLSSIGMVAYFKKKKWL